MACKGGGDGDGYCEFVTDKFINYVQEEMTLSVSMVVLLMHV